MNIIVEFTIQTQILPKILDKVPAMKIKNTALYPESEGRGKILGWAWGDDFDAFEGALDDHGLVSDYECLTQTGDRCLYTITHIEEMRASMPYPLMFENNGIVLDATATREGFDMRVRFPSRDNLIRYQEGCKERGIPFLLHKLYEEDGTVNGNRTSGVTEIQRETLACAFELGYFDIPRQAKMEEVAGQLNISTQAVSTRLRRGQQNLIRTICRG